MIHVVAVDENLIVQKDPVRQIQVWSWMHRSSWTTGRLIAEIPRLAAFDRRMPEGGSLARWREFRILIERGHKSIRVPDPVGRDWRDRAEHAPFVNCLVSTSAGEASTLRKRVCFEEYLELDPIIEEVWNNNGDFLNTCGVIFFDSKRIDIIDRYLLPAPNAPLAGKIPLVKYLEDNHELFEQQRRQLVLHIPEQRRMGTPVQVTQDDSVATLLARMNASGLERFFDITFRVWQFDRIHDRLILGDAYGLQLGDGLNAERRKIVASRLNSSPAIRKSYEKGGPGHRYDLQGVC